MYHNMNKIKIKNFYIRLQETYLNGAVMREEKDENGAILLSALYIFLFVLP